MHRAALADYQLCSDETSTLVGDGARALAFCDLCQGRLSGSNTRDGSLLPVKRKTTKRLGFLTHSKSHTHLKPRLTVFLFCLCLGFGADCLAASESANAPPAEPRGPAIVPGATELSPSRAQYFSWINNRNEGATEAQTLANLEFFKWLHDEYGMLPGYLFDGNPDTFCDLLKTRARDPGSRQLRLDLGKATRLDHVLLEAPATGALRYAAVAPTNHAKVSVDLKTWTPACLAQDGRNIRIECDPTQPFRYLRTDLVPDKLVEIRGFSEGKELDRGGWRASWLFPRFQKVCQAWSLPFSLDATAPGSYLTVACNGVHGREGAWVALRVDGRWVGAPQRAPSYPVNPWEYPVSRTDRNYSYFIPVTRDMLGKACEVVVLGFDSKNLDFKPDVWLTAYPVPYQAKTLTLSE